MTYLHVFETPVDDHVLCVSSPNRELPTAEAGWALQKGLVRYVDRDRLVRLMSEVVVRQAYFADIIIHTLRSPDVQVR